MENREFLASLQACGRRAQSADISKNQKINLVVFCGGRSNCIYCEIDSGGDDFNRDEPDPDDMTDYGYYHRNHSRRSWTPPGYGDDD